MSTRKKTLMGLITAALLVAGVAWAADVPGTAITDRTVVPVDGAGTVTLEIVSAGLSLVEALPDEGWTVTVERSVGPEVEAHFESQGNRVEFNAELEDGEIRVEIERTTAGSSSTSSTTLITSTSTSAPSTSSTVDDGGSSTSTTSGAGGSSTSTTMDDDGGSTSTTMGDGGSTSTTMGDGGSTSTTMGDGGSTSTTMDDDGGSTSTTMEDDDVLNIPDGPRTFTVGAGGSITVNVQGGRLSLASVSANSGWSYEVDKAESDDIRVEFENGDAEAEIRVRINDGQLEVEIDND